MIINAKMKSDQVTVDQTHCELIFGIKGLRKNLIMNIHYPLEHNNLVTSHKITDFA